jgi:hypothetical protein
VLDKQGAMAQALIPARQMEGLKSEAGLGKNLRQWGRGKRLTVSDKKNKTKKLYLKNN